MPQLRLKLSLDKRLSQGAQRRRYKKLIKRYEKQLAYVRAQRALREGTVTTS